MITSIDSLPVCRHIFKLLKKLYNSIGTVYKQSKKCTCRGGNQDQNQMGGYHTHTHTHTTHRQSDQSRTVINTHTHTHIENPCWGVSRAVLPSESKTAAGQTRRG